MYDDSTKRLARRLGVKLPTGDVDTSEALWSSDGHNTLFEGPCKLDFAESTGTWRVSLRRSGRKGGYRKVQGGLSLAQATELALFLRNPENRRAYRGLRPQGAAVEPVSYADQVTA